MPIIGIDLGTTNSLVSCFIDGKSRLIPNAYGKLLTPSVVSVLDNGEIIVGQAAKERLYTHPHLTVSAFKRFMGTKKSYDLGSHSFTPVELSSIILGSLKKDAEKMLNSSVYEAVISVPAYFNDHQRTATKQAGELAGLKVSRLISEPAAAALSYGLHESDIESKFMVFDLGGGTFDVSVAELFDDVLEIKAVAGNSFLGGEDFDTAIAGYFIRTLDLKDSLGNNERLMIKEKAEYVKRLLSSQSEVLMRVIIDGKAYELTITQALFEKISEPVLTEIRGPIVRALNDAKVKPEDLSRVIMVGGSCHMPLIKSYAARMFQKLPLTYIDPDEVVGIGAGISAALKERNVELGERIMTDVCPFTLGIEVVDRNPYERGPVSGKFYPVLERNTVIPVSRVEQFYTVRNDQEIINVEIFQGESYQTSQNLKLGEIKINVPPKPAGKASVDVRFTYDINGILEVLVTSIDTGVTMRKIITNSENQMTPDEIEEALNKLSSIKIHPREQYENRLLIARAERLFEESLGEEREIAGEWISMFNAALNSQDAVLIKEKAKELSDFLEKMEKGL